MNDMVFHDEYTGPRWSYGLRNRPLSLGAQPKGWIIDSLRDGDGTRDTRHGIIDYPRQLTPEEISAYELTVIHEPKTDGASEAQEERVDPDGRIGAITLRVVPVTFSKDRSLTPRLIRCGETKVYDNGGKSWPTTWAAIEQEFLSGEYRYTHESHTRCVQVDGEPHAPHAVLDTPDISAPMMAVWSVCTPRLFKEPS